MALIEWSQEFSVGVARFDEQHKRLVGLINQLHGAMASGKAKEELGEIVDELVKYTKEHFRDEEQLQEKLGYSGLGEHRLAHRELMRQVEEFHSRNNRGEIALSVEVQDFLKGWLINHIMVIDKKYGDFFSKAGVK